MVFSIRLQAIELYGYHGFYPEEQVMGCTFMVSVEVRFPEEQFRKENLDSSVNYEKLYKIVKQRFFSKKYRVLETMAQDILDDVKSGFSFVTEVYVRIEKVNPPLGGKVGASVVELQRKCVKKP